MSQNFGEIQHQMLFRYYWKIEDFTTLRNQHDSFSSPIFNMRNARFQLEMVCGNHGGHNDLDGHNETDGLNDFNCVEAVDVEVADLETSTAGQNRYNIWLKKVSKECVKLDRLQGPKLF